MTVKELKELLTKMDAQDDAVGQVHGLAPSGSPTTMDEQDVVALVTRPDDTSVLFATADYMD